MDYSSPALKALSDYLSELQLPPETYLPRFEALYELLMEANQRMNLTRITDREEFYRKHIHDSLTLLPHLPADAQTLLDLGTGGGLPGLAIWLVRPQLKITLLDSVSKKLKAIEGMVKGLVERFPELKGTEPQTLHMRAEDAGQHKTHRQQYEIVVSRAVSNLPVLVEWALPLVKRKGTFIAMKGPQYESEMQGMGQICGLLGARIDRVETFELAGEQRHLLVFEKRSLTPNTLPRPAGQAQKKPLSEFLLNG